MGQEEHVLHQLKALHDWTVQANKQMARIMWILCGLIVIAVGIFLRVMFK